MIKNSRLLIYSLISLSVYLFFSYSPLYDGILQKLEKTNGTYGFGLYVLIKLGGTFLLFFGCIGLILFFYELLKSKWKN